MALGDKDVVVEESHVTQSDTVEKITLVRNRELSGAGMEVHVERRIIKDGRLRLLYGRVPEAAVNEIWDDLSKKDTLDGFTMFLIDNAQF
jgi:hypothetical protein